MEKKNVTWSLDIPYDNEEQRAFIETVIENFDHGVFFGGEDSADVNNGDFSTQQCISGGEETVVVDRKTTFSLSHGSVGPVTQVCNWEREVVIERLFCDGKIKTIRTPKGWVKHSCATEKNPPSEQPD